jgi:hypothetical protein
LKDSTKRLTTLTKKLTPTPEELEEITKLNGIITELNTKIAEFLKNQTDLEDIYNQKRKLRRYQV